MRQSTMQRVGGVKAIAIRLYRGMHHVGTLLQLSNGRWVACDPKEQPISKLSFLQPTMARDHFDETRP